MATQQLNEPRSRLTGGLVLIALGVVFFLQQANILDMGSNWWVIFLAIPGLVALGSSIVKYMEVKQFTSEVTTGTVAGVILLLLSAIFIWDPTWSFTRGWDKTFPFLRNMGSLWPWILVVVGAVLIFRGWSRTSSGSTVVGGVLVVVGVVFILNISWNVVWPLLIVALGVSILFAKNEQKN